MRIAAVVLAAGAATRMGRVKQLLPFRGMTLLERVVRAASQAEFQPVIVVLGAQPQAVARSLAEAAVTLVENPLWPTGMGSSIAAGVRCLEQYDDPCDAVAILLADQPLVEAHHLRAMAQQLAASNAHIVAAHYSGGVGVPALFRQALFPALTGLDGQPGAKALLRDPRYTVLPFDLAEAATDVDTPEEFQALNDL